MPYSRTSKFKPNRAFTGVKFGRGKALLEVELNEMQEVLTQQIKNSNKAIFQDGFIGLKHVKLEGTTFKLLAQHYVKDGLIIPIDKELTLELTLESETGFEIFFEVNEKVVRYTDNIPLNGNLNSGQLIDIDDILDNELNNEDKETARRTQIQYNLIAVAKGESYSGGELLASISSEGTFKTFVKEKSTTLTSMIDEIKTYVDSVTSGLQESSIVVNQSHKKTGAVTTTPVSLEFAHNVVLGEESNAISLTSTEDLETNLRTSVEISEDSRVLKILTNNNLTPNTEYKVKLPLRSMKDRFGNIIPGAYEYVFLTRSNIQELQGTVKDLLAETTKSSITLGWRNPLDVDLAGVKILKRSDQFPTAYNDSSATVLAEGLIEEFQDNNVLENTGYYYAVYPYDSLNNFNELEVNRIYAEAKEQVKKVIVITPDASIQDINYLITNAPSGTELLFGEGNYNLNEPLTINRSNISIKGSGLTTLKRTSSTTSVIDIVGTIENPLEDISISGITVDGMYSQNSYTGYGINITNVGKYDSSVKGLNPEAKVGVTLSNCTVKNSEKTGLNLTRVNNSIITGIKSFNNRGGIYLSYSNNNNVTGNTAQNNINTGINLGNASNNNVVTGNTVQNNSTHGILLGSVSNSNTIMGNTIQNNGGQGIYLSLASNNNTVTGNTSQNNSSYGIFLTSKSSNNTITGNTVQNNSNYGVYLSNESNNNTFMGNIVTANSNGGLVIYKDCSDNLIISNNTLGNSMLNLVDYGVNNSLEINK